MTEAFTQQDQRDGIITRPHSGTLTYLSIYRKIEKQTKHYQFADSAALS